MYRVFVRNWWKWKTNRYGQKSLEPDPRARKYTIANVPTEEMARQICQEYNQTHKPGPLSRKAEYMFE